MRVFNGFVALALLSLAAACGDDDEGGVTADAAPAADTAPAVDAPPEVCTVDPDYGDVGALPSEQMEATRNASGRVIYAAALNADQDQIQIELFPGVAPFTGAPVPGTYELSGDQLQYKTCGLCVRALGNVSGTPLKQQQDFLATGGTVVITEVGPTGTGRFTATLTNITFEHVEINAQDFTSTPVGDGCVTAVGNLVADSPIVTEM